MAPPSPGATSSSQQRLSRSARLSLLARLSLAVPVVAALLSVALSRWSFLGQSYARLAWLLLSLAAVLSTAYLLWFRKAIAPRKSRGGPAVKGRSEDDENEDEDEDAEEDEEEAKQEAEVGAAAAAAVPQPLAPRRSRSADAAEELDDKELDDTERLSRFWHPQHAPPSALSPPSALAAASTSASAAASDSGSPSASPSRPALPEPLYFLASTKYISSLSEADFASLYRQIAWQQLAAGTELYRAGAAATDGIFIVVSGTVSMHSEARSGSDSGSSPPICYHGSGELIGEEAVFDQPEPRWLSCRAVTDVSVIRMSGELLSGWKAERPELIASFIKTSLARQWRIAEFCLHSFLRLPQARSGWQRFVIPEMERLLADDAQPDDAPDSISPAAFVSSLSPRHSLRLTEGQLLFAEGSHAHQTHLFIVVSGSLRLSRADHPHQRLSVGAGAVLDPLSFIADTPHHFSATAEGDALLTFLTPAAFSPRLAHPCLYALLMAALQFMQPTLRLFSSLGLKLEWRKAGETLFVERQPADDWFVMVSGRVRVVSQRRRRRRQPVSAEADAATSGGNSAGSQRSLQQPPRLPAAAAAVLQSARSAPAGGRPRRQRVRLELGRGECCGESSFLSHDWDEESRHSATAVCLRDSEVVRISRRSFVAVLDQFPAVLGVLTRIVSARLEQLLQQADGDSLSSKQKCTCIALVPLAFAAAPSPSPSQSPSRTASLPSSALSFASFARSLCSALSAHGATLHLTPALVDGVLGSGSVANLNAYYHRSRFTAWLTEQEEANRFLVFQADGELTAWTSLSVRTADYALLVADSGGSSAVGSFEWKLMWAGEERRAREEERRSSRARHKTPSSAFTGQQEEEEGEGGPESLRRRAAPLSFCVKELVLLHPAATSLPSGTRAWLAARPHLHRHHHVRCDLPSHYDRLARAMANKSIGAVLGGGGARGLAHQGVLSAAVDLRIPIDCIGGTSQGSMMAGLFAQLCSQSREEMDGMARRVHDMARQVGSLLVLLSDATFPIMSFFSGRVFSEQLAAIVGPRVEVEDLWLPYFCISTNMSSADLLVHRSGLLWQACRASMSILEYLPPMQLSADCTDLLIDGGYINNCVAAGSLVSLADGGSLPIERVRVGQRVLARCLADAGSEQRHGLTPLTVTAVLDQGERECVELLFADGRSLVCTEEHRVLTAERGWQAAGELLVGESEVLVGLDRQPRSCSDGWSLDLRPSLGFRLDMTGRAEETLAFARLLGRLLADGCLDADAEEAELLCRHRLAVLAAVHNVCRLLQAAGELWTPAFRQAGIGRSALRLLLPLRLTRAFLSLGLARDARAQQVVQLPAFLLQPDCPLPVVQEFVSAFFGDEKHVVSSPSAAVCPCARLACPNCDRSLLPSACHAGFRHYSRHAARQAAVAAFCHRAAFSPLGKARSWSRLQQPRGKRRQPMAAIRRLKPAVLATQQLLANGLSHTAELGGAGPRQEATLLAPRTQSTAHRRLSLRPTGQKCSSSGSKRRLAETAAGQQTKGAEMEKRDEEREEEQDEEAEASGLSRRARLLPLCRLRLVGRRRVGRRRVFDLTVPSVQGEDCHSFLANGVLVHNCPVDVMRDVHAPLFCLAVDVEQKVDSRLQQIGYYGHSLNGWWLLGQKLSSLLPRWLLRCCGRAERPKLASYSELISALLFIGHNRNIRQFMQDGVMDVYVRPQLGETQLLDYHKEEEIVRRGYSSGRAKLTEWRLVQGSAVPTALDDQQPLASAAAGGAGAAGQQQQQQGGRGAEEAEVGRGLSLPSVKADLSRSQTLSSYPPASSLPSFSASSAASGGKRVSEGGGGGRRGAVGLSRAASSREVGNEEGR